MSLSKKSAKQILILFVLMLVFMLLFSVSFLLMSPGSDLALNSGQKWLQVLSGAMFWVSLIAAYSLLVVISIKIKKLAKGSSKQKLPGIITFFSSKEAIIADVLTAVFLIALLICWLVFDLNNMLVFVFISLFIFFLQMRSVLNGKNYRYIKSQMLGGKKENE